MSTTLPSLSTRAALGSPPKGPRLQRLAASERWQGDAFANPVPTPMGIDPRKLLPLLRQYAFNDAEVEPSIELPLEVPVFGPPGERLRITWMGHSSMLIELDGRRVLTDPVWGPRASPFGFAGPARFHPPPVALSDLPPLDAVLISHDHYDHLDHPSIVELARRDVPFYAPLGVGSHLEAWGVQPERIHELDWWDEVDIGGLRLVSAPARHFSGRSINDRNKTLWTSYALIGREQRTWFSGDTGPADFFDEVGERLGPFDVTMIECGAWNEAWGTIHLGPDAAAVVHRQVRGRVMVPIHWGTFNLALHAWDQPIVRLQELAEAQGITLAAPIVGGVIDPDCPSVAPFWQDRRALVAGGASRSAAVRSEPAPTTIGATSSPEVP
jgi:L-ascorbate metabolism protein UlaG (beta-lactamase superfamily)